MPTEILVMVLVGVTVLGAFISLIITNYKVQISDLKAELDGSYKQQTLDIHKIIDLQARIDWLHKQEDADNNKIDQLWTERDNAYRCLELVLNQSNGEAC